MPRTTAAGRREPGRGGVGRLAVTTIGYPELRRLLDQGTQLVEVLPVEEYAEMHLPGAVNIPLKTLDAATTADLDRARPVVVYCWDGL